MSKKLFVGGIAWGTTPEELKTAFEYYGPVQDAKIITDRETGQSRGFGFVTFENAQDAEEALEQMHDSELNGRKLRVNLAHEQQPRPSRAPKTRNDSP